jgi:hypothetical protein
VGVQFPVNLPRISLLCLFQEIYYLQVALDDDPRGTMTRSRREDWGRTSFIGSVLGLYLRGLIIK